MRPRVTGPCKGFNPIWETDTGSGVTKQTPILDRALLFPYCSKRPSPKSGLRLLELESALMRFGHIAVGRLRELRDAFLGTGVDQQRQHIRRDPQGNPDLKDAVASKRPTTYAAQCGKYLRHVARQARKWWPMFVISVKRACAYSAAFQL